MLFLHRTALQVWWVCSRWLDGLWGSKSCRPRIGHSATRLPHHWLPLRWALTLPSWWCCCWRHCPSWDTQVAHCDGAKLVSKLRYVLAVLAQMRSPGANLLYWLPGKETCWLTAAYHLPACVYYSTLYPPCLRLRYSSGIYRLRPSRLHPSCRSSGPHHRGRFRILDNLRRSHTPIYPRYREGRWTALVTTNAVDRKTWRHSVWAASGRDSGDYRLQRAEPA